MVVPERKVFEEEEGSAGGEEVFRESTHARYIAPRSSGTWGDNEVDRICSQSGIGELSR